MGVLLSFFFSVSGIQTVVACMVLRRGRNLGATKGSDWQKERGRVQARTRRRIANFTHALISIMQAKISRRVQREQRRNIQ